MQQPDTKPNFTPRVLISHCVRAASIVCGIRRDLLLSDTRQSPTVALARQLGMAVAADLTGQSLPAIGRGFGGRDHTTVIHAIRKVEETAIADRQFAHAAREVAIKARQLAGVWPSPQQHGMPVVSEEVRKPTLASVPSMDKLETVLTDVQRREMVRLRAKGKGWSVGGLARRYSISIDQVYRELGETPPNKIAA
jgi:hypothetical protein